MGHTRSHDCVATEMLLKYIFLLWSCWYHFQFQSCWGDCTMFEDVMVVGSHWPQFGDVCIAVVYMAGGYAKSSIWLPHITQPGASGYGCTEARSDRNGSRRCFLMKLGSTSAVMMAPAVGLSGGEESVMLPTASNPWSHTREVASWCGEEFPAMVKQTWSSLTETLMPDVTLTRWWIPSLCLSHNESVLALYCKW